MKFPILDNDREKDVLTMAFVNMQPLNSIYEVERGFMEGTLFPSLNKPLEVGGRRVW